MTKRSVRDHFNILETHFKRAVYDEDTPFEKGMQDIIDLFHEHDILLAKEKQEKENTVNKEKEQAQDMLNKSLETFRETQKRKAANGEEAGPSKRGRKSETELFSFMKEKTIQLSSSKRSSWNFKSRS